VKEHVNEMHILCCKQQKLWWSGNEVFYYVSESHKLSPAHVLEEAE